MKLLRIVILFGVVSNLACYTMLSHPKIRSGYRMVDPGPSSRCISCHEQPLVHQDPLFRWYQFFNQESESPSGFSPMMRGNSSPWWLGRNIVTSNEGLEEGEQGWTPLIDPGHPENPPGEIVEIPEDNDKQSIPDKEAASETQKDKDADLGARNPKESKGKNKPDTGSSSPDNSNGKNDSKTEPEKDPPDKSKNKNDKKPEKAPDKSSSKWKKKPKKS
jgi:hypothetical protein